MNRTDERFVWLGQNSDPSIWTRWTLFAVPKTPKRNSEHTQVDGLGIRPTKIMPAFWKLRGYRPQRFHTETEHCPPKKLTLCGAARWCPVDDSTQEAVPCPSSSQRSWSVGLGSHQGWSPGAVLQGFRAPRWIIPSIRREIWSPGACWNLAAAAATAAAYANLLWEKNIVSMLKNTEYRCVCVREREGTESRIPTVRVCDLWNILQVCEF